MADLTRRDVKVAHLKNLQGYLWQTGYATGAYATPLFPDVAPRLKRWKAAGVQLAIYSSGSVFAQKLLFGHVGSSAEADGGAGRKRARGARLQESGGVRDADERPTKKRHVGGGAGEAVAQETGDATDDGGLEGEAVVGSEALANGKDADGVSRKLETEDLQPLITAWFDTTNAGPKTEAGSYEKIADALKVSFTDDARCGGVRVFLVVVSISRVGG